MWFTKDDDGFRGWLTVMRNGRLHTGVAADITVTVVDEDDSTSTTPAVSESTQLAGLYTFLIPSAFFTTNGTGQYSVVAVVDATGPTVRDVDDYVLRVFEEDFDSLSTVGDIFAQEVEPGVTFLQALRAMAAESAGAIPAPGPPGTAAFGAIGNPGTTRFVSTATVNGDRQITLSLGP
jgi:hypothetical protein